MITDIAIDGTTKIYKDGHLVYWSSGDDWWRAEYDERGNQTSYVNSNDFSWQSTYNEKNLIVNHSNSNGYEIRYFYDDNGNEIYSSDSQGVTVATYWWEGEIREQIKKKNGRTISHVKHF